MPRAKALDDEKRAAVCSLVAAGVSLRQAAHFLDCDPQSIRREVRRNDDFRQKLAKARAELSVDPLNTLRAAAKTNWRAALSWMERVEPERFARRSSGGASKRDVKLFIGSLVEAIERIVRNESERRFLFEVLSAAMPGTIRQCWDGFGQKRDLNEMMRSYESITKSAVNNRHWQRLDLFREIVPHLPRNLVDKLDRHQNLIEIRDSPVEEDENSARQQMLATARRHAAHATDDEEDNDEEEGDEADDAADEANTSP
jgi:hypothetical protein